MSKPLVLAVIGAFALAGGIPDVARAQSKCSGTKIKASGKKAATKLGCLSKGLSKGIGTDSTCLAKAEVKFSSAVAKAEAKAGGNCLTSGDQAAIETRVDALLTDIDALVDDAPPNVSACDAAKVKATGKKTAAKLTCHSKAVTKALTVDSTCLAKAEVKFSNAVAKAETKAAAKSLPCTATGDASTYETIIDAAIDDIESDLAPTTTTTSTTSTTSTSTTSTTMPAPDWGLPCFTTTDCGPSFCASPTTTCQCADFLASIGVPGGSAMCFFDCMDLGGMVTSCGPTCSGPASPPVCDTSTAGAGGFTGAVTGAGKCEPSGFSGSVTLGGTTGELKRLTITFSEAIDESTLFAAVPPACDVACPPTCPATAAVPLDDRFRLQIGVASPAPEMCDRLGVSVTACKKTATSYILVLDDGICTPISTDVSIFISCHVENAPNTSFLHLSTGDFFGSTSWPP